MPFHEMLNEYMLHASLNITALKLSEASELSPAVISRYRSAERTPAPYSEGPDAPGKRDYAAGGTKKGIFRYRRKAC